MKKSFIPTLILFICLGRLLVVAAETGILASFGKVQNQRQNRIQPPKSMQEEISSTLQEEPANSSSKRKGIDDVNTTLNNKQTSADRKAAAEAEKRAVDAYNSGLKGTTSSIVMSGVPGRQATRGPTSIEFAIAPIEGDKPAYEKAIFVESDRQGKYEVTLPPGKYWIGPKAKALDPVHYRPGAVVFSEKEAVVREGVFTQLELLEIGYAP